MRVGVIGPQAPDLFADNVCDSLSAMGIENVPLGGIHPQPRSATANAGMNVARMSVRLDEAIQMHVARRALAAECTHVITLDGGTSPRAVADLRNNGVPVALWFPDAVTNLGRGQMLLADYSALFFKEPRLVERLRATLDLPVRYLPEACNPHWHTSNEPQGVDRVIAVVGNMYPSRLRLLERLVRAQVPLALYGPGFPRWVQNHPSAPSHRGRYIARTEKADVFRRAAAVLNNLHPGEVDGVNCRLFEAAGSGAVVLSEWRPAAADLFAENELLTWTTFDQLIAQIRRALELPGSLSHIGDRAAIRAHSEHTYAKRLNVILETIC